MLECEDLFPCRACGEPVSPGDSCQSCYASSLEGRLESLQSQLAQARADLDEAVGLLQERMDTMVLSCTRGFENDKRISEFLARLDAQCGEGA